MSTKYTKDGKKVAVLGKLNSEESIVQEIFVSNGQEVPGGENFVAKGLLDAPAESWKDRNLREKEESYERHTKELQRNFDSAVASLREQTQKARAVSQALFKFANGTEHAREIETLRAFLCGEISHFFIDTCDPRITTWGENTVFDDRSYTNVNDGMRLVSLWGRSDGSLDYRISHYGDGSGSTTHIFPFKSYQEALAKAQERCDEESKNFLEADRHQFNPSRWAKIEGIAINQAAMDKYAAQMDESRKQQIAKLRMELSALEGQQGGAA